MDPLYYRTPGRSPYSFVANNPVNFYDVMGLVTNDEVKTFFELKIQAGKRNMVELPIFMNLIALAVATAVDVDYLQ